MKHLATIQAEFLKEMTLLHKQAMDFSSIGELITPEKALNDRELSRAIRLSIAAELDATHLYELIADATTDEIVKKVLQDISNEEKVHAGELQELLKRFDQENESFLEEGKNEVQELLKEAMGWDDLSYDEQREYLRNHPASKKHITSFPKLDHKEFLKVKGNDVITDPNNIKLTIPEFERMNVPSAIKGPIGKLLMDKGARLSQIFGTDDLYTDDNDIVLGDETIGRIGKSTFLDIAKNIATVRYYNRSRKTKMD